MGGGGLLGKGGNCVRGYLVLYGFEVGPGVVHDLGVRFEDVVLHAIDVIVHDRLAIPLWRGKHGGGAEIVEEAFRCGTEASGGLDDKGDKGGFSDAVGGQGVDILGTLVGFGT